MTINLNIKLQLILTLMILTLGISLESIAKDHFDIDTNERWVLHVGSNEQNRLSFNGHIDEVIGDTNLYNLVMDATSENIFIAPKIHSKVIDLTVIVEGFAQDLRLIVDKGYGRTYYFDLNQVKGNRGGISLVDAERVFQKNQDHKYAFLINFQRKLTSGFEIITGVIINNRDYTLETKGLIPSGLNTLVIWTESIELKPGGSCNIKIFNMNKK